MAAKLISIIGSHASQSELIYSRDQKRFLCTTSLPRYIKKFLFSFFKTDSYLITYSTKVKQVVVLGVAVSVHFCSACIIIKKKKNLQRKIFFL